MSPHQVFFNPTSTGPRTFLDAISAAGFEGALLDEAGAGASRGAAEHAEELERWRTLLVSALVFTVPVFLLAMVLPMVPGESQESVCMGCWGPRRFQRER
jgi:Cu+-exporting ATPase